MSRLFDRRWQPVFGVVALGLLMGALSGCASDGPPPACPRAAIVDEAKVAAYYREGTGRDLTDITFEVGIPSLTGVCEYDFGEGTVRVGSVLTIGLEAKRGPAGDAESVEVPYFVAVVDPEQRILAKQVFRPRLTFAESGIRAQAIEEIEQIFAIGPEYVGEDYEILVGLQLDRGQLEENLTRKRR